MPASGLCVRLVFKRAQTKLSPELAKRLDLLECMLAGATKWLNQQQARGLTNVAI